MATSNKKKVEAPVKRTVKTSSVKVRHVNDVPKYFAKKDTTPLRDEKTGEVFFTDDQLVAEGLRQPLVAKVSFKKTAKEREELKKVHSSAKGPRGGRPTMKYSGPVSKLIVQLRNVNKNSSFKTTHSFECLKSEISQILDTFFKGSKIVKYHFNGKTYQGQN